MESLSSERPRWQSFLNPTVSRKPKRLFEICDLNMFVPLAREYTSVLTKRNRVPSFIKHRSQATLTAEWVHRIPLLQKSSPAALAASLLLRTLDVVGKNVKSKLSVVDFCSGGGGSFSHFILPNLLFTFDQRTNTYH